MQKLKDLLTGNNAAMYVLAVVAVVAAAIVFVFVDRPAILESQNIPGATASLSPAIPEIAYLSLASGEESGDIWRVDSDGSHQTQITFTGGRVKEFAVSGDGKKLAFTAGNDQGGADLWIVNRDGSESRQLVNCGKAICSSPAWSPDDQQIAYSRSDQKNDPLSLAGLGRVWLFDFSSGQANPLYSDANIQGIDPSWSPDGQRIAEFDSNAHSIRVLDLKTKKEVLIPASLPQVGCWSPGGDQILYTDLVNTGNQSSTIIKIITLGQDNSKQLFAQDSQVSYSSPVWSPDGAWIALSSQPPDGSAGKQIEIVKPDGSGLNAVTTDSGYNNAYYRWNASSTALVFQRYQLGQTFVGPEIAVWHSNSIDVQVIAKNGVLPQWLP